MKEIKISILFFFTFLLSTCTTTKPEYLSKSEQTNSFQPVVPIRVSHDVIIDTNEKIRYLSSFSSYVYVEKVSGIGGIQVPVAGAVTADKGTYRVTMDFGAFDVQKVPDSRVEAYGRYGVGIRIVAEIVTSKVGLNVSGLSALSVAAEAESLSGSLLIDIFGFSSPEVLNFVPFTVEINSTSINSILQDMAVIKNLIFNEQTIIRPYLISVLKTNTEIDLETVVRLLTENYDQIAFTSATRKSWLIANYTENNDFYNMIMNSIEFAGKESFQTRDSFDDTSLKALLDQLYITEQDNVIGEIFELGVEGLKKNEDSNT